MWSLISRNRHGRLALSSSSVSDTPGDHLDIYLGKYLSLQMEVGFSNSQEDTQKSKRKEAEDAHKKAWIS